MAGVVKQFFKKEDPVGKLFSKGDVVRIMPSGEVGGRAEEAWQLVGAPYAIFDPDDQKTPSVPGVTNSSLWVQLESKAPYSGLIEVNGYNEADNSITFRVDDGSGNVSEFKKSLPTFGITDNGDGSFSLTDGESGTVPTKIYGGKPVAALDSDTDTLPLAASQGRVLQSSIDSEAQTRAADDSALRASIDSETQARLAADTAQATLITALQASAHPALSVSTGSFSWDASTQTLTVPVQDSSGGWVNTSDGSIPVDRSTPIETDGVVTIDTPGTAYAKLGVSGTVAGDFRGNLYQAQHLADSPVIFEQTTGQTAYFNVRDTQTDAVVFRQIISTTPAPRYSLSFKWNDSYREGMVWDAGERGLRIPQGVQPALSENYLYIDPVNGDDANMGASKASPVKTLERASENFVDGAVNTIFINGDISADTTGMQFYGGDISVTILGRTTDFSAYENKTLTLSGGRQWPYAYGRLMMKLVHIDLVATTTPAYLMGAGGTVDFYAYNSSFVTDNASLISANIRCQSYFASTTLPPGKIFYGYAAGATNLGRYADTNLTSA